MLLSVYLLGLGLLVAILRGHGGRLLRPSVWFAAGMMIRVGPMALWGAGQWSERLASAQMFRFWTLALPVGVLLWAFLTPRFSNLAEELSDRCRGSLEPVAGQLPDSGVVFQRLTLALGGWVILTLVLYLREVPLRSTGLVAIFTNPVMAAMAREESLKLVGSPLVRYLFMWHTTVVALILAGLLIQNGSRFLSWGNGLRAILLALLLGSVMLTGARYPGGALLMVLGMVVFLKLGPGRGFLVLAAVGSLLLLLVTGLTIFREGQWQMISPALIFDYLRTSIFHRVFMVPFEIGMWTNILAQEHGLFGIAAIRPLALLAGIQPVNIPNLVGMEFFPNPLLSINAATCFLFQYQAAFGFFPGWLLSLVLACGLDFLLPAFGALRGRLLVAFLASFLVANMVLVGANFTTALLSHGIGPIAILGYLVGRWQGRQPSLSERPK